MCPSISTRWMLSAIICLSGLLILPGAAIAQHDGDVLVGRSSANQLKNGGFIPDLNVVGLPCVNGLFQGWATNNPGFDRLVNANIPADFHPMDAGALIRIECVSIDPAFRVISPSFSIMDAPGESILLGGSSLHIHLTWHINSADPLFAPTQTGWFATFKLVDTGSTGYAESAPFTFHFKNGDCLAGDANDDGSIDGRDVQVFTTIVLDPQSTTDRQRCLADCNRDCNVSEADIAAFVDMLIAA